MKDKHDLEDLTDEYAEEIQYNTILFEAMEKMTDSFSKDLSSLINIHGVDNTIGVPDYILAEYLTDCIKTYAKSLGKIRRYKNKSSKKK